MVSTANGKKLALTIPYSFSVEHSVSSLAIDRACSSDSLSEMKGLRLIDMENLLASVTRRASCNVCGSGLLLGKTWGFGGVYTKLTLSCTNPLCTGDEGGRGSAGLENIYGVMGLPPPVFSELFCPS